MTTARRKVVPIRANVVLQSSKSRTLVERMVSLYCQTCGNTFRYRYPGTGPYRSFCKRCNPNSATWSK